MSIRSELRQQAMDRASGRCEWPAHRIHGCDLTLEMSHIIPSGSGGKDEIDNVWMLCRSAHGLYDGRIPSRTREWRELALAYVNAIHGDTDAE